MRIAGLCLLLSFFLPAFGFASDLQSLRVMATEQLAEDYMKSKELDSNALFHKKPGDKDWRCEDENSNTRCVDFVCDRLGRFGCDTTEKIKRVTGACLGNRNEKCLANVCNKLGRFGCDTIEEIEDIAPSCRGVWSTKCIDTVCSKLGRFGCDESRELKRVSQTCKGVDSSCIDSLCARLGSFGCDTIEEISEVARACRGD